MKNNEFEEWENSLEGIFDSLNVFHSDTEDDKRGKILIGKTLAQLPKDIQKRVLENVKFIFSYAAGTSVSMFFHKPIIESKEFGKYIEFEQPIIILNFKEMKKGTEMDVIAHEIAHFILGHNNPEKRCNGKIEREADNLAEKWGFKRSYTKEQYMEFERKVSVSKE